MNELNIKRWLDTQFEVAKNNDGIGASAALEQAYIEFTLNNITRAEYANYVALAYAMQGSACV